MVFSGTDGARLARCDKNLCRRLANVAHFNILKAPAADEKKLKQVSDYVSSQLNIRLNLTADEKQLKQL